LPSFPSHIKVPEFPSEYSTPTITIIDSITINDTIILINFIFLFVPFLIVSHPF